MSDTDIGFAIAFGAGVFSFLSPCVLPLVPSYLAFVTGMSLEDLGRLGYTIVADPSTPLLAAFTAWKKVYAELAQDFGSAQPKTDWSAVEHEMLGVIDIEKLLAVERATVEKGKD